MMLYSTCLFRGIKHAEPQVRLTASCDASMYSQQSAGTEEQHARVAESYLDKVLEIGWQDGGRRGGNPSEGAPG